MISDIVGNFSIPNIEFEINVQKLISNNNLTRPHGNNKPAVIKYNINQFQRDANVKAWILKNAQGICENCYQKVPFSTFDGVPYLEIHHVKQLADGGPDTVDNTVAVCPNCHRELHYGENAKELSDNLYKKISRLKNYNI